MSILRQIESFAGLVLGSWWPAIALLIAAWALGRRLTSTLEYRSRLEATVLSAACGLGVLATGLFLLAMAGRFEMPWVLGFLVATQIASREVWRGLPAAVRTVLSDRRPAGELLLVGALGAVVAPLLLLPLYPPIEFDATMFHLPFAQAIANSDAVRFFPQMRYPVTPALQHMLFATGLELSGSDLVPAVIHLLAFLLVALLLFAWGRDLSSSRAGLWAALLWLGTPTAIWSGTAAYVDCTLTLFVISSLLCVTRYAASRQAGWLWLGAAFAAFAAGTKYHGLFFVAVFVASGLATALWLRKPKQGFAAAALVAVLILPWYVYTTYPTGNPVFPFAPGVFGYSPWAQELIYEEADEPPAIIADETGVGGVASHLWQRIALSGASSFLELPFDLSLHPEEFRGRAPSPFYVAMPLLMVGLALRFRHALFLGGVTALYGFLWLHSATDLRYLLPIAPIVAVVGAEGLDRLLRWRPLSRPQWIGATLGVVVTVVLLAGAGAIPLEIVLERGLLPTHPAARVQFVQRYRPTMKTIAEANRRVPEGVRIYGFLCEDMRHYVGRPLLGDWFGPHRYAKLDRYLNDPEKLHQKLSSAGVRYLILPDSSRLRAGRVASILTVPPARTLESHFEIVYQDRFAALLRLRSAAELRARRGES